MRNEFSTVKKEPDDMNSKIFQDILEQVKHYVFSMHVYRLACIVNVSTDDYSINIVFFQIGYELVFKER